MKTAHKEDEMIIENKAIFLLIFETLFAVFHQLFLCCFSAKVMDII